MITSATSEIFVIRAKGHGAIHGFCPGCAAEVKMSTLDEAIMISALDTRTLISLIDSGSVHSVETQSGHLVVCQVSLKDFIKGVRNEK